MKKTITFLLLLAIIIMPAKAADVENVKPVKNVILLIPDGTSLATVSMARWLQWYTNPDKPNLNLDPYLCGTVRTHSSNAPIGDSAPTTSCYMTGYPSRTGYVSTYPEHDGDNDIYPTDPERAFQPLTTVLEAAKMTQGKSTGLVFTCEFPHATPADCSAHSYNRGKYEWIAPQMAHNDLNVVIGGGASLLPEESEAYLKGNGYGVFKNDISGMRNYSGNNMWALFGDREMAYDIDRDPSQQPSLEEMTRKAIEKLSQNPNGFFLMVEGSKVDWAAHANDPVGMATDMLAFDRACGAALEFARQNGETAVVIVPDHGNSGISIGRADCKGYDKLSKDHLFHQLSLYKLTAEGFAKKVNSVPNSEVQNVFREYAGFELTPEELDALNVEILKGIPGGDDFFYVLLVDAELAVVGEAQQHRQPFFVLPGEEFQQLKLVEGLHGVDPPIGGADQLLDKGRGLVHAGDDGHFGVNAQAIADVAFAGGADLQPGHQVPDPIHQEGIGLDGIGQVYVAAQKALQIGNALAQDPPVEDIVGRIL